MNLFIPTVIKRYPTPREKFLGIRDGIGADGMIRQRLIELERSQQKFTVGAYTNQSGAYSGKRTGNDCGSGINTGAPNMDPCYRKGRPCDWARIPNIVFNTAAATAFALNVQPINKIWFEPIAAANIVTENGNPNANARVRYTAFSIAGTPQEPFDNRAPVAGTTQALWSDHFLPNTNDANPQPVIWGVFGQVALGKNLQIDGFNPGVVAVDVEFCVYGNTFDNLPPGMGAGEPIVVF